MAEQKITQHLLDKLVQGKQEKDARFEALLEAIKIPSNINKLLKIKFDKPFNVAQIEEIIDMKAITSDKPFNVTQDKVIIDLKAAYYQILTVNKD